MDNIKRNETKLNFSFFLPKRNFTFISVFLSYRNLERNGIEISEALVLGKATEETGEPLTELGGPQRGLLRELGGPHRELGGLKMELGGPWKRGEGGKREKMKTIENIGWYYTYRSLYPMWPLPENLKQ